MCLPSGAMDNLHVRQLSQSGCAAEHKGGSKPCVRTAMASNNAPGAVAGSASELPRAGSTQLRQHEVYGLVCHLERLGPERHRHQRAVRNSSTSSGSFELLRHWAVTRLIS